MRKFLHYFLTGSLWVAVSPVLAQDGIYIGAKGGISIPNLSSGSANQNPLSNGYSSRLGADFGALAEFPLCKWVSIQPEIDYSAQGGKHDGMQAIPDPYASTPPYLYANFKNTAKLNYLLVPVMAKFSIRIAEKWKLYLNAGAFGALLLSAKTVSSGNSYVYVEPGAQQPVSPYEESFDTTQNIKSSLHDLNFGVIGAVGISYSIGQGKLFLEGGGNYGFVNIQKYSADGTNYTGAATVHIGYAYAL